MKSYTRYIRIIQDFQFNIIDPLKKTGLNNNYRFGDLEDLNVLKNFILTELKVLTPGNLRLKLKKLKEINALFMHFDQNYSILYEKARTGILQQADFKHSITFLPYNDLPDIRLTPEFIKVLYQSIIVRQNSLLDLINRVEDSMAGIAEENIPPTQNT